MKAVPTLAAVLALALAGSAHAASCTYDPDRQLPSTVGEGVELPSAAGTEWLRTKGVIEVDGRRYRPYGSGLEISAFEMGDWSQVGVWRGVPVFGAASDDGEVVHVPIDPKVCAFQQYEVVKD